MPLHKPSLVCTVLIGPRERGQAVPGVQWGRVYQQGLGGPGEEEVSWATLPKATQWEAKSPSQGGRKTEEGGGAAQELKLRACCMLHCPKLQNIYLHVQNRNLKIKLLNISKQQTKSIKIKARELSEDEA